MAVLNAKQKKALIKEIQQLSTANKFFLEKPQGIENVIIDANKEIVNLTRVLLGENDVYEFISMIGDLERRKHYLALMRENSGKQRVRAVIG